MVGSFYCCIELLPLARSHALVSFCPDSVTSSNMVCVVMFLLLGYLEQPEYVVGHVGHALGLSAELARYITRVCACLADSTTDYA